MAKKATRLEHDALSATCLFTRPRSYLVYQIRDITAESHYTWLETTSLWCAIYSFDKNNNHHRGFVSG